MKNKKGDDWYPFWIDKWLFGSTKFEFTPAERSVWIDLLTLAHKDSGFIRANIDMPYPIEHLANIFVVPVDLLTTTIEKCIKNGKLEKLDDGSLFVASIERYELTKRHKRRFQKEESNKEENNIIKENRIEENRVEGVQKTDTPSAFADIDHKIKLSELLFSLILERKRDFKRPNIQQWTVHIDRMIRLDKRAPECIEAVIRWCQKDDFWQNNILSTQKLRKQFDQLELKMTPKEETMEQQMERLHKAGEI